MFDYREAVREGKLVLDTSQYPEIYHQTKQLALYPPLHTMLIKTTNSRDYFLGRECFPQINRFITKTDTLQHLILEGIEFGMDIMQTGKYGIVEAIRKNKSLMQITLSLSWLHFQPLIDVIIDHKKIFKVSICQTNTAVMPEIIEAVFFKLLRKRNLASLSVHAEITFDRKMLAQALQGNGSLLELNLPQATESEVLFEASIHAKMAQNRMHLFYYLWLLMQLGKQNTHSLWHFIPLELISCIYHCICWAPCYQTDWFFSHNHGMPMVNPDLGDWVLSGSPAKKSTHPGQMIIDKAIQITKDYLLTKEKALSQYNQAFIWNKPANDTGYIRGHSLLQVLYSQAMTPECKMLVLHALISTGVGGLGVNKGRDLVRDLRRGIDYLYKQFVCDYATLYARHYELDLLKTLQTIINNLNVPLTAERIDDKAILAVHQTPMFVF